MTTEIHNLIGGEWTGDAEHERRNPARPDELVAVSPRSEAADIEAAVSAAVDAQPAWAALPAARTRRDPAGRRRPAAAAPAGGR